MSLKFGINACKWVENTSQCNILRKSYSNDSDEGYFLEVDVQYSEEMHEHHNDLPFLPGRMKIKKVGKLVANLHDK